MEVAEGLAWLGFIASIVVGGFVAGECPRCGKHFKRKLPLMTLPDVCSSCGVSFADVEHG